MFYKAKVAVCYEIHTKHIKPLCAQKVYLKIQSVPRSKHSVSVIKTSQLMLYKEIIAVCSETHTKHTNALCGGAVEFLMLNLAVRTVTTGSGVYRSVKSIRLCTTKLAAIQKREWNLLAALSVLRFAEGLIIVAVGSLAALLRHGQ
jgi:hypothetical protein